MQNLETTVESPLNIEVLDKKIPIAARDFLEAIENYDRVY